MSRVANKPVIIPQGVEVVITEQQIQVKGAKDALVHQIHPTVDVKKATLEDNNIIQFAPKNGEIEANAQAGTTRALVSNMIQGVSVGFSKQLELVGVGYRAQLQGKTLNLTLGYSHPIKYTLPDSISTELPNNTTIIIKGASKQQVGQVAAEIRAFRPPEPYKGKGIRYAGEQIKRKETKKK